jgi:homoserine dehydrogenase
VIFIHNSCFQVGAGLPVIASVTRIVASGDPISRIVGSLSGMHLLIF